MKSWKTTALGILTGIGILITQVVAVLDNDPETVLEISIVIAGLSAMGFGWFARDDNVTSESAGAK